MPDFSHRAKAAEAYAYLPARQYSAELHVLFVSHDLDLALPDADVGYVVPPENWNLQACSKSERACRSNSVEMSQMRVMCVVRTGWPEEIVRYA